MTKRRKAQSLIMLSILMVAAVGCAAPSTQLPAPPTPTLPDGWVTYSSSAVQAQCSYTINHPSDIEVADQGPYSWYLNYIPTGPSGPIPNFIYISVIPDDYQGGEDGSIYNYHPVEAQTLLNLQVGESGSLRDDPNLADWFSYTRLPDATFANQTAQAYENTQPWEFPPGTQEIRYYLQGDGCTYLIGGYMSTVGSGQTGAIDQELFEQIITTFRPAS